MAAIILSQEVIKNKLFLSKKITKNIFIIKKYGSADRIYPLAK